MRRLAAALLCLACLLFAAGSVLHAEALKNTADSSGAGIASALQQPDDTPIVFSSGSGKTVSANNADFPGYLYIQEPMGCAGIRVHYTGALIPARGALLDIAGAVTTGSDGEREIDAGADGVTMDPASPVSPISPRPMAISNRSLGGAALGVYTPGVTSPFDAGCYNKGLLVKVWGRVSVVDSTNGFFYLDDGANLRDGSGNVGVKVSWGWPAGKVPVAAPHVGWYVSVIGISGSESDGQGGYIRVLRPRDQRDLLALAPQDASKPSIAITIPADGTLHKDPNLGVALIAGTASDPDTGVAYVEVAVVQQGQPEPAHPWAIATYSSVGNWTFNWGSVRKGVYTIYASATDFAGNTTEASLSDVTVTRFASTLTWASLNFVCPPEQEDLSVQEADWLFEMSHLDMAIASEHLAGLRARNSDIYLLQYEILNTIIVSDAETMNSLQSYATAHGYDVEDAFLHFYDDTTVQYSDGTTEDIPGWGGGSATSRQAARMKGKIYGLPRRYFNLKSSLTRGFWGERFRGAVTTGLKPDGVYVDENCPFSTWAVAPDIVSGGSLVEYDRRNKEDSQMQADYYSDQIATYSAVNSAMGHDDAFGDHLLVPDVGQYPNDLIALGTQGADGLATKLYVDEGQSTEPDMYWDARQLAEAGKIFVVSLASRDVPPVIADKGNYASTFDRHQMYGLTEYWIAKQGISTYYGLVTPTNGLGDPSVNASYTGSLDTTIGDTPDLIVEPGKCFYYGVGVHVSLGQTGTWFEGFVNYYDPTTGDIEMTVQANNSGTGIIATGDWKIEVTSGWWGPLSSFWCKACEFDLGKPLDETYVTWQTGGVEDPTPQDLPYYEIYGREYENALLLSRPQYRWVAGPDYTSEVQVETLPSGVYRLLHWDGTLGPPITSIGLAMGEAVTLVKVKP